MDLRIIAHCDFDMWLYNVPSGLRNDQPSRRHWHEKLNYGGVCMLPYFSNFIAISLFFRVPLPHFLRLPSVCFICGSRTTLLIISLTAITWHLSDYTLFTCIFFGFFTYANLYLASTFLCSVLSRRLAIVSDGLSHAVKPHSKDIADDPHSIPSRMHPLTRAARKSTLTFRQDECG